MNKNKQDLNRCTGDDVIDSVSSVVDYPESGTYIIEVERVEVFATDGTGLAFDRMTPRPNQLEMMKGIEQDVNLDLGESVEVEIDVDEMTYEIIQ
jgi:hypothetical protein